MALPSRDQTFAFENCRDVRDKLEREVERYSKAICDDDIEAMKDLAFNISVTAWHLTDWVFEDLTPAQRALLKISHTADLQKRARKECRSIHLCRQAATASKHWKVSQYRDPDVSVIVSAAPHFPSEAVVSPIPIYYVENAAPTRWYIYFVDREETRLAEDVFEEALNWWTQFIYQNQIAAEHNVNE